ncbi:hypothetical protein IJI55_00445 [Candidatus Saccharibacteria bacterium]|nr:hypothetical protein [Candidatus Saccharibacteria bacterium]MBR0403009.1 hypothetical protein [Candidatus Saccharibacteria bacterium]
MLNNIINEVIVLIASLTSLVVILNAQSDLGAQFRTKSGALFTAFTTVALFIVSASPIMINIAIILFSMTTAIFSKKKIIAAAHAFAALAAGSWVLQIIRIIFKAKGFKIALKPGRILYLSVLIVAIIATILAANTFRKKKPQEAEETAEENEDKSDDDSLKGLIKDHPVVAFVAIFAPCAVAVFIAALIFA